MVPRKNRRQSRGPFRRAIATAQVLVVLGLPPVLSGCMLVGPETTQYPSSGIVIGYAIDGVELGFSRKEVEDTLGPPSSVALGDFDGVVLEYDEGVHAGLRVLVMDNPDLGVTSITALPPYVGKSTTGIGLGSSDAFVRRVLGEPARSWGGMTDPGWFVYEYDFEGSRLQIEYRTYEGVTRIMFAR